MITYEMIRQALVDENPGLFTDRNDLLIHDGLPPEAEENSAGVWISRPIVSRDLQVATIGGPAVYDEESTFSIIIINQLESKKFEQAKTAVFDLGCYNVFRKYYSKPWSTGDDYNDTHVNVEYAFVFKRTVVR